jgi:hypothetical protein
MNWPLGLSLVFLLVLSLAILHMAYTVVPEKHMVAERAAERAAERPAERPTFPEPAAGPVAPGYLSPSF